MTSPDRQLGLFPGDEGAEAAAAKVEIRGYSVESERSTMLRETRRETARVQAATGRDIIRARLRAEEERRALREAAHLSATGILAAAEQQAEALVADAEGRSREVLADADQQGESLLTARRDRARAEADHMLRVAHDEAVEVILRAEAAGRARAARLIAIAEADGERVRARVLAEAEAEALEWLEEADDEWNAIVGRASDAAGRAASATVARVLDDAQEEARRLVATAETEAARIADSGRRAHETLLDEGQREHDRLIRDGRDRVDLLLVQTNAEIDSLRDVARTEASRVVGDASQRAAAVLREAESERGQLLADADGAAAAVLEGARQKAAADRLRLERELAAVRSQFGGSAPARERERDRARPMRALPDPSPVVLPVEREPLIGSGARARPSVGASIQSIEEAAAARAKPVRRGLLARLFGRA